MTTNEKRLFINAHGLDEAYLQEASNWFDPTIESLSKHQKSANTPFVIGVNGCQGSGKTTLADYFALSFKARGHRSVAISIDDFYLTHQQRQRLAEDVHPLLASRGVPGTHDTDLALQTLNALKTQHDTIAIPRFDKAQDDRSPNSGWPRIAAPVDIIILEGWCVGLTPQANSKLTHAINPLEALEDSNGQWRHYVNQKLARCYQAIWRHIDCLIMLQAPSFDCVYKWRLEQENKLAQEHQRSHFAKSNKIMGPDQVKHFIQHYERLTRHCLFDLPKYCHHVFELSSEREVLAHYSQIPLSNYETIDTTNHQNSSDIL